MGDEYNIEAWLKKANEDEEACYILFEHDGSASHICFLAQQMAEKHLKTLLIFHTQNYPRVHDLKLIATRLEPHVPDIFNLEEEFNILNKFYPATRYPGDFPEGFSKSDADEALAAARKVKKFVLHKIKK